MKLKVCLRNGTVHKNDEMRVTEHFLRGFFGTFWILSHVYYNPKCFTIRILDALYAIYFVQAK